MTYGISTTVEGPFDPALDAVRYSPSRVSAS